MQITAITIKLRIGHLISSEIFDLSHTAIARLTMTNFLFTDDFFTSRTKIKDRGVRILARAFFNHGFLHKYQTLVVLITFDTTCLVPP